MKFVTDTGRPVTPEQAKMGRSLQVMSRIMTQVFDPNFGASPGQLCDATEMFLASMHLRKVTPDFFTDHLIKASALMKLTMQVEAEARLFQTKGLDADGKKTIKDAVDISMKEISKAREGMLESLELMDKIPLPGMETFH